MARRLPVPVRRLLAAAYTAFFKPRGWRTHPAPGTAIRLENAARRAGGQYLVVREAARLDWSQLRYADGSPVTFPFDYGEKLATEAVGWVGPAVVSNAQSWPVTSRGELVIDAVRVRRTTRRYYEEPQRLGPAIHLRGGTLNINCASTRKNYAHAVLDGVGRLAVASKAGVDLNAVDHIIVPAHPSPTLARVLDIAGVPRDKRRPADWGAHFQVDSLIQPTISHRTPIYSATGPEFLRSLGVEPTPGPPRRLLMLRLGERRRAIANPEGLEQLAREYDLELYDPARSEFSPSDFAAAELIVAAHGAALGDLGFCAPGTRLVEVLASGHLEPHFATLAISAGLQYVAVRARTLDGTYEGDFEVDYDELREGIERVLSRD